MHCHGTGGRALSPARPPSPAPRMQRAWSSGGVVAGMLAPAACTGGRQRAARCVRGCAWQFAAAGARGRWLEIESEGFPQASMHQHTLQPWIPESTPIYANPRHPRRTHGIPTHHDPPSDGRACAAVAWMDVAARPTPRGTDDPHIYRPHTWAPTWQGLCVGWYALPTFYLRTANVWLVCNVYEVR